MPATKTANRQSAIFGANGLLNHPAETTLAPSGASPSGTLDLNTGNAFGLNLAGITSGLLTLTLTVPAAGSPSARGRILAVQGATPRNLTIVASDSSTVYYFGGKQDSSTDPANSRRSYTWDWNGSNLYLSQTDFTQ